MDMDIPGMKLSGVKNGTHSDLRAATYSGISCQVNQSDYGNTRKGNKNKKKEVPSLKIGTWNVRTMNKPSKRENLEVEMEKHNIDILGLGEIRWPGEGETTIGDYTMIYKGGEKKERGVGFIFKKKLDKNIIKIIPKSDRIIAMKIRSYPVDTLIIQVYMPTSEADDEDVEEVYKQIEEILDENGKGQVRSLIIGDWNSVVGEGREGNIVGNYGYGRRNERGDKLVEFCGQYDYWISNTWFEQPKRRLYTWKIQEIEEDIKSITSS
uniref:Craniofacial development protein 2 n=1 Tax=Cacopsylla melanoneura TaxID=428564 RepID=A0A8D9ALQ1_9HEMI